MWALICHEVFDKVLSVSRCIQYQLAVPALCFALCSPFASAQITGQQQIPLNRTDAAPAPVRNLPQRPERSGAVDANHTSISAVTQDAEGSVYKLHGAAVIETSEMILHADEVDYDRNTGKAEARGNVKFDRFRTGEHIEADRVEYNVNDETGKFYNVRGSTPAKVQSRPGVLTTTSPFSFEGKWAERIENRYILHDGYITNCKLPKPWWILRGSSFDIIPEERAIAKNSVFWLKKVPLFYSPTFYKSLESVPRKSGFLTPNIGNSSRRGKMIGGGYYWAISRNYDAAYRGQLFTDRGFAHHVDLRGKPTAKSDFNLYLYGVNDRGQLQEDGSRRPSEGGYLINFAGKADLPKGWEARAQINYLTSFAFRQAFTESFFEAVFSEVHSQGSITKHWSTYAINLVGSRVEAFQSTQADDKVSIRKLPSIEFNSRDHLITDKVLPVYLSFDSSASVLRRHQINYVTKQFVDRLDFAPRVSTALHWKDFHLVPSFTLRETNYGASFDDNGKVTGNNLLRSSREVGLDLELPALTRYFEKPPAWMGTRLKHVIEPRASFRYVTGINDFRRYIRFDETELLSNTTELEVGITNRVYAKKKDGRVDEILSWDLTQRRYFEPCFGGVEQGGKCIGGPIIEGQRNVLFSTASVTGLSFLDTGRRYSPVASTLRMMPKPGFSLEWRADYDPARNGIVNSNFAASGRFSRDYFVTVGHNQVHSVPVKRFDEDARRYAGLSPNANQFFGMVGYGQENRRGFSAGFLSIYDYTRSVMTWASTQVTYNTDCCGYSVQYRRFGFGNRNENQFRAAFAIANIGSFGTLRRQERMF